jgi:hypothetical protein
VRVTRSIRNDDIVSLDEYESINYPLVMCPCRAFEDKIATAAAPGGESAEGDQLDVWIK